MKFIQKRSFLIFWLTVALAYALIFIGVEFSGSPVNGFKGMAALGGQWVVVSASAAMVIGLIAVNRWVFSVAFPILLTASAIAAYFKITMGLSLTPTLIELTMVNDWSTWVTVISFPLVLAALFTLALSVGIVWLRWRKVDNPRRPWIWAVCFACGVMMPVDVIARFKAPVIARMPYSFWYSFSDWMDNRKAVAENRTTYDNIPASAPEDAPDVVFIIGESLRPDHLSINGYSRPTTPCLERDSAVVSFTGITTDYLYTHVSVPHIMTREVPGNEDAAYEEQSFISLFRKARFRTAWFSNQDEVNTYAYFMHEGDTLVQCNSARSLYGYDKWTDADLLPHLDKYLAGPAKRKLAVMHTIGSHWWYPSHYPDSLAVFNPEVDSRIVSELSQEQMINSYDNTILATDRFLSSVIDRLKNRNAVMIFISDHGECLGENGNYLHADDFPELRPVACLVWTSPEFSRRYPDKVAALESNATRNFSTAAMFHSVLDAASVATPVFNPGLSLFHNPQLLENDSIR